MTCPTQRQLPADQELHLQTALIACRAVESLSPSEHLKSCIHLHNIAEHAVHTSGSLKVLVCLSSETVPLAPGCKSCAKIEPVVYVAFANQLQCPGAAGPQTLATYLGFLAALQPAGLPGAGGQYCWAPGSA